MNLVKGWDFNVGIDVISIILHFGKEDVLLDVIISILRQLVSK